jgi:Acetoacetate decarboxylase (ADC)
VTFDERKGGRPGQFLQAGLGRFVSTFGSWLTFPPPVVCEKVLLYLFVLPEAANPVALTDLCREAFDVPSQGNVRCWPTDERMILQFGSIARVSSSLPDVHASVQENQVLIHVPVQYKVGNSPAQAAYFTPFIWVDNPISMAGGRETFGYPKGLGSIKVPDVPKGQHFTLSLKTWLGAAAGGIWQGGQDQIVVETQAQQESSSPTETSFTTGVATLDFFLGQLKADPWPGGADSSRDLFKNYYLGQSRLAGVGPREIFLKQFRAIDSSPGNQSACFQQIATADYATFKITHDEYPYYFNFTMANFDSAPVATRLGMGSPLGAVPNNKSTSVLEVALRLDIDKITIGDPTPTVLWQMGIPAKPSSNSFFQRLFGGNRPR